MSILLKTFYSIRVHFFFTVNLTSLKITLTKNFFRLIFHNHMVRKIIENKSKYS